MKIQKIYSSTALLLLSADAVAFTTTFLLRGDPTASRLARGMGLYDQPLPPPPPSDDDKEDFIVSSSIKLFEFDPSGKEVNDLLPPLGRRLDTTTMSSKCYMEPYDRLVQNLVQKTSCHVEDACWALEACQGDTTEAWTRISYARRVRLQDAADDAWDPSAVEKRFQQIKEKRLKEPKRKEINYFQEGKADENWLPRPNPKPIDDEPWFTG